MPLDADDPSLIHAHRPLNDAVRCSGDNFEMITDPGYRLMVTVSYCELLSPRIYLAQGALGVNIYDIVNKHWLPGQTAMLTIGQVGDERTTACHV